MNEIAYRQPETVDALQQHIDVLALEIRELHRQITAMNKFMRWQSERIVELEQRQ